MSYYVTKIFVHLSVIAAVCYSSVPELMGWDPANISLFNRKRSDICPKLTINTVESRPSVFEYV